MKILSTKIHGEIYCFIEEYELSFGKIYKFANREKVVYCEKENESFIPVKDKFKLNEIEQYFKVQTDVVF